MSAFAPAARDDGYVPDAQISDDILGYLAQHAQKPMLRFITCGSVDDGKSTLIGRMLYDSKMIFDDQLTALENDSRRVGTQGNSIDFALLVDGLAAEREQGITIDVAYRFFATEQAKFIVADCPGHEQYTRNMVTGASTADLAIILIDARKGVLPQTRRHSYLVHLLGVKHIVLAINKMDLIDYDRARYNEICDDYRAFANMVGIGDDFTCIPISGFAGDNITAKSTYTPWFGGDPLITHLEEVAQASAKLNQDSAFRMSVQWVNRPNLDFRGFAGTIASGSIQPGDAVRILPSGKLSHVGRIVTLDGDLDRAQSGQSITLTLTDEIDCSRGNVIVAANDETSAADRIEADIVWMAESAMVPGRSFQLKLASQMVPAKIQHLNWGINIQTLAQDPADQLGLNDIGRVTIDLDRPIIALPYADSQMLGSFILIDSFTNQTVGAGMIRTVRSAARNIYWQAQDISREARARLKGQDAKILWFTGLSGSGKSTIANLVEKKLHALGKHSFLLDGDNIRHGLNRDLRFSDADRVENIRRVAEVARLMSDAGLIVISAFISPFAADRALARSLATEGEFIEVFVDTPISIAEQRDPKGLYKKARAGEIANFTGIDSAYEAPEAPEIYIDTTHMSAEDAADHIVTQIIGDWAYQI
jgi:bifunctional enzyme CysN/CysC